jgi:hypothetical protein
MAKEAGISYRFLTGEGGAHLQPAMAEEVSISYRFLTGEGLTYFLQ